MDDETTTAPEEKTPKRRPVWRAMGCLLQLLGAAFLFAVLLAVASVFGFLWWASRDTRTPGAPVVEIVEVRKGDSLRRIAERLEKQGIASPAPLVMLLALKEKTDRRLMPGRYAIQPGTPPREVLGMLARGPDIPTVRVTLPEGWTTKHMAERLAAQGAIANAEAFLALVADATFLKSVGIDADSAEGFLFPDTYRFEKPTAPADVVRRMVARFNEVIAGLGLKPGLNSPHSHGLMFRDFVTLASIVEREARDPEEMPAISAVFHNRLKRGMRLDSCATVRYALDQWNAPLRLSDLKTESPYNTYTHQGLPPGPICNPGRAALNAAFRPAKSGFLYYVYRGDGKHAFSKTLREHERLSRKYRDAWAFSASRDAK